MPEVVELAEVGFTTRYNAFAVLPFLSVAEIYVAPILFAVTFILPSAYDTVATDSSEESTDSNTLNILEEALQFLM